MRPVQSAPGFLTAALLAGICLLAGGALAQSPDPSLADAARTARKSKAPAHADTKVYDNDTLPKESTVSVVGSGETSETSGSPPPAGDDVAAQARAEQKEWRAKIVAQERTIAELQDELNRLERDSRTIRAEFEDTMTGKPRPKYLNFGCNPDGWGTCSEYYEIETERSRQYKQYVEQRDAKKAELQAAQEKLEQIKEEARQQHVNMDR